MNSFPGSEANELALAGRSIVESVSSPIFYPLPSSTKYQVIYELS
jgi:hypothetical protein